MKKILIVNGSKRMKGNSYALENRIAEQLKGKADVTLFEIGKKDVSACLACDACKRQHTPNCIQNDDFTSLIPEIDSCDAMLILAPVHWDQFPAQLKAFLDRTYSFMDFTQPDFSMAGRKDKKLAGYFFAGFGPVNVYTQMVETNLKSFATAGFRDYKAHVAGDANVPGSIMEKPADLKAADEIVEWLLN
ncbi:MAG: flavodoxin family protein [Bacteroidales bacterium]|nr:flavodoxin family protein [Bacteroidales bacterium]MBR3946567.1 flavodoxin family protein [Bacteroidales bacterium]